MSQSGNQVKSGKAFEYALAQEYYHYLSSQGINVELIEDRAYKIAEGYYDTFSDTEKELYDLSARASIPTLLKLEPGLSVQESEADKLLIHLSSDSDGETGDVRDVIFSRPNIGWETGISAKNNNDAVKHSRLSMSIDFGKKWIGHKVSDKYWDSIRPIFDYLSKLKSGNVLWSDLGISKFKDIYVPLLKAFIEELKYIDSRHSEIPQKLVQYLIGEKPFYKIIKDDTDNVIIVKAFNIDRGLNQSVGGVRPMFRTKEISMPSRIVELDFKKTGEEVNDNTIDLIMDNGWEISFRIHNARSRVEPSLKFDIRLLGNPPVLFTQYIFQE